MNDCAAPHEDARVIDARLGLPVTVNQTLARSVACTVLLSFAASASAAVRERLIDIERSFITIRVASEGPLGGLAAPVLIQAPLTEGSVEESVPHMQIVIDARQLRVLDAGLSPAARDDVQARLKGPEVLDVERFGRISYHSITIERRVTDWLIRGELELRGLILPVTSTARRQGNRYVGSAVVRQSEFGIAPIVWGGGLSRVKDEIAIEFDVTLKGPPPSRTPRVRQQRKGQ